MATSAMHKPPGSPSYSAYRKAELLRRAPRILLAGAGLIAAFNVVASVVTPTPVRPTPAYELAEAAIPLVAFLLLRFEWLRGQIGAVLLACDAVFTVLVVEQLGLSPPDPLGVALLLSLKVTGTTLMLSWTPGLQVFAATYTAVLYLLGLWLFDVHAAANTMITPALSGLLSVIGMQIIDGHRRRVYQQQAALAESEDNYRSLTEGAVAGVFVYQDDRFCFVNDACARMLGYARGDLLGHSNHMLHRPEDLAMVSQLTTDLLTDRRRSFDTLLRAIRRDGSDLYARGNFSRIQYDHRPAVLGIIIDVTAEREQQRAAEHLAAEVQASEARYRDLFENSTDLIIEADLDGYFTDANRAALMLAGYTRTDLTRRIHLADLLTPDSLVTVERVRREMLAGRPVPQPYVVGMIGTDGMRHSIELQARLIQGAGQPPRIQSIGRDVTERHRVEAQRQSLLAQTQQVVAFQHAVAAVTPTLHGPHGLDETCADITRICRELFGVDAAYLGICEGDTLAGRGASGLFADEFLTWRFPLAEPLLAPRAFREQRPLYVNDLDESAWRSNPIFRMTQARAWMVIPLLTEGGPQGIIALLDRKNAVRFDDRSAEWARIFAAQAVLAIENARLRDRERTEARTTATLLALAQTLHARLGDPDLRSVLVRESAHAIACDMAAIVAWQPERERFRVVHVYGVDDDRLAELESLEFEPRNPAIFSTTVRQFGRTGATPVVASLMDWLGLEHVLLRSIRHDDQLLAMLVFARRDPRPFSVESLRLADGIAYQAAIVLENLRLLDALHAANRLKSDFVATMSHELRSPLNVIIGYADLLRDGQFGPLNGTQTETLDRVLHHSEQLLDLINTTLDLSRLERGEVAVTAVRCSLADIFAELQAELAPRLPANGLAIHWQPLNGMPPLHTDRGKLKLILRNLVDNALKFTETGTVEIAASHHHGVVEIRVDDTGRGIPPESLASVFDMFRQVESGDSRTRGGVGLGLYIVRRLVTMLGGTVDVTSTPGVGSAFRVTIPREHAAAIDGPQLVSRVA